MAYTDVDTTFNTTHVPGDLTGRIRAALVRQAIIRVPTFTAADDQKELRVLNMVVDGSYPAEWLLVMLSLLDTAGQLPTPTDADLDEHAATAFDRYLKTRV